ncbi:hypothetical protein [Gorillibacterium sp. sgz5001074]|uniref:hypothetical protein n=1 Tax=Gorillibacterium sp. sgz5001074 TaxID=3446695 RepID=UPI003F67195F
MPSYTPNLGLYKKDPATDGNDAFNLTQMLNDPLDVIDEKLGSQIIPKADTGVTIQPGLQVIHAARQSRLKVQGITGRTLVNWLGRTGSGESLTGWSVANTVTVSTTQKRSGDSSFKVDLASNTGYIHQQVNAPLAGKQYLVGMWVFIAAYISGVTPRLVIYDKGDINTSRYQAAADSTIIGQWQFIYTKIPVNGGSITTPAGFTLLAGVGGVGTCTAYMDEIRVYEMTAAEAAVIDSLTADQVAAKYPYVEDVKPVDRVYVTRFGKNLLPPVTEWDSIHANAVILGPYKLTLSATAAGQDNWVDLDVVPGQVYSFSVANPLQAGSVVKIFSMNDDGSLGTIYGSWTFTATTNKLRVYFGPTRAGTYTLDRPMLAMGNAAATFEPREDHNLYLPDLKLHSNVDGSIADQLFHDGKELRKLKWFREVTLDGTLSWTFGTDAVGYKNVMIANFAGSTFPDSFVQIAVKYDGKILTKNDGVSDGSAIYTNGTLHITVSDADTGWGEAWNSGSVTVDYIKAYFNGWKYVGSPSGQEWKAIGGTITAGLSIASTLRAPGFTPYNLIYQMSVPINEPVRREGGITLQEGPNQVEMGTGIVVREKANPVQVGGHVYRINSVGWNTPLKYRLAKFIDAYRNKVKDKTWYFVSNMVSNDGYGVGFLQNEPHNYNPSAAYEVTYQALDTYKLGTAPMTISAAYSGNMKEALDDLELEAARTSTATDVALNKLSGLLPVAITKSTKSVNYYVDAASGNDANDGLSTAYAFRTIQAAVNSLPKVLDHNIYIVIQPGTYAEDVTAGGFSGKGSLYIGSLLGASTVSISSIALISITCAVTLAAITLTSTTLPALTINRCAGAYITSVISSSAYNSSGIDIGWSRVFLLSCQISNKGHAVYVGHVSQVRISACSGTGNTNALYAENGAVVTRDGIQPTGNIGSGNGAVIDPWGDNTRLAKTGVYVNANADQSVAATTGTKVLFGAKQWDYLNEYATASSRFTAAKAGTYLFDVGLRVVNNTTGTLLYAYIYKNGVLEKNLLLTVLSSSGTHYQFQLTNILTMAAGDYAEIYIYASNAVTVRGSELGASVYQNITRIS